MISVLVVDDSVVVRRLIVDALGGAENIEVVGTASNGLLAQAKIARPPSAQIMRHVAEMIANSATSNGEE